MRLTLLLAGLTAGSLAFAPVLQAQASGSLRAVARVHHVPRDRESLSAAATAMHEWVQRSQGPIVRRTSLARVSLRPATPRTTAGREPSTPGLVIDIEYLRN